VAEAQQQPDYFAAEGGWAVPLPELPRPKTPEEAAKLDPGTDFLDPEGKKRTVPYRPKTPEEAAALPEGAQFLDPQGKLKTNPKYQGVGFTAQMLHDMALTEKGQMDALKTIYGDKVKVGPQGLYVEDDNGVFRKPDRRGLMGAIGGDIAELPPLAGMAGGTVLGGGLGTLAEPGGGTAAGGFLGMVLGAGAGRAVDNAVLAMAGVHEGMGEQLYSIEKEGALAAGGEVAGKAISAIPGATKAASSVVDKAGKKISGLKQNLSGVLESIGITPERARVFLGTDVNTLSQAADINARGGRVAPSVALPGASGIKKMQDFHELFEGRAIFGEAARDFYEQEAKKVVESPEIGVSLDELLTRAEKKVSSQQAGESVIAAAHRDLAHDDAVLENAVVDVKNVALEQVQAMGGEEKVRAAFQSRVEALNQAHEHADVSARRYIEEQVKALQEQIDEALAMTKKGEDPSALMRMSATEFRQYARATKVRAKTMYNAADAAAGGELPPTEKLSAEASGFLESLPKSLRDKYPTEIRDLARLAGEEADEEVGKKAIPPEKLTFGQLHHLRSWLRHGIDYNDLTPDMRSGALRTFAKKIDAVLHDSEATPALRNAAEMLDRADAFYKEMVPFLNDQMVTSVIKAMESGAGANPEALAKILFDPERTAAMRKVRSIVGENMWKSVQAAHLNDMLMKSRMANGRVDAQRFAQMLHDDVKNGLIETAYDSATARRVAKIAEDAAKLKGDLPIDARPEDTISTLMRKTQAAKEAADKFAANDPLVALDKEMTKLDKELKGAQMNLRKGLVSDPLKFIYQPRLSHMAVEAADKILGSQDLIVAAANKFGRDSPEFNALRQVYVTRFFQRPLGRVGTMREELGGEHGMTEEVQALMFPGVTRGQFLQVVRDMEFLFSGAATDVGGSLAGASRVLNPWGHIPLPELGGLSGLIMKIPGSTAVARFFLGKFFATMIDAVSHPDFINWLAGNLRGNIEQREMARAVLRQRFQLGGMIGAGTAQTMGAPNQ
jgi:hypothetical protein